MPSGRTTVILPLNLGAASKYDRHVFPRTYHDGSGSNVGKGSLLLSATLEEMVKIKQLGIDLSNSEEFLFNTRIEYEVLAAKREKLQNKQKTLNPFKAFQNYRAARMFHAASLSLYLETKETSEKIQRSLIQTVPSAEMHVVDDQLPEDSNVSGIAIDLPALDDDALQTIHDINETIACLAAIPSGHFNNPHFPSLKDDVESIYSASLLSQLDPSFFDNDEDNGTPCTPSETQQADTTNPSSPRTIIINNIRNSISHSIVTTNSSTSGLTINHKGSQNSGASISK